MAWSPGEFGRCPALTVNYPDVEISPAFDQLNHVKPPSVWSVDETPGGVGLINTPAMKEKAGWGPHLHQTSSFSSRTNKGRL